MRWTLAAVAMAVALAGCSRDEPKDTTAPTTPPATTATTTAASADASTTTAPRGPADGPVPKGFRVSSLTFVSEAQGWAFGQAPCPRPHCSAVLRTRDGGRTWAGIPAPNSSVVSQLRFADAGNGWAFDAALEATHDGGATWHPVTVGTPVVALEAAKGRAWALVGNPVRLFTTPVDKDDWKPVAGLALPPAEKGSIVVAGDAVYVAVVVEGDQGGIALYAKAGERWEQRTSPCPKWGGAVAASAPTDLAAVCQIDEGAGGTATHEVFVSSSGGAAWTRVHSLGRTSYPSLLAATSRGTFLGYPNIGLVSVTRDGAKSFQDVLEAEGLVELGFTSPAQGFAIGEEGAWLTKDAGAKWTPIAFE